MKRLTTYLVLLCSWTISIIHLQAQEICGTDALFKQQLQKLGLTYKQYTEQMTQKRAHMSEAERASQAEQVYYIPIVFHILHFGGKIGAEESFNMGRERIDGQMETLNAAFAETHPNVNNIPEDFQSARAGDTKIKFFLANRDPEGNPSDGITRTEIPDETYDFDDMPDLKAAWDQNRYLNVWIIPIDNLPQPWAGLATYPPVDNEGEDGDGELADFDGMLIATEAFWGGTPYRDGGISLIHEIGHYLSLHHPWGPGDPICDEDDLCDDTPNQGDKLMVATCSEIHRSCEERGMIENYMGYAADACMLMFTQCQRNRMRSTLAENKFRRSLWQRTPTLSFTQSDYPVVAGNNITIGLSLDNIPNSPTRLNIGTNSSSDHILISGGTLNTDYSLPSNSVALTLSDISYTFSIRTVNTTSITSLGLGFANLSGLSTAGAAHATATITISAPALPVISFTQSNYPVVAGNNITIGLSLDNTPNSPTRLNIGTNSSSDHILISGGTLHTDYSLPSNSVALSSLGHTFTIRTLHTTSVSSLGLGFANLSGLSAAGAAHATAMITIAALPLHTPTVNDTQVHVYPNPTSARVRFAGLSAAKTYPYRIYTVIGQLICSGTVSKDDAINTSSLFRGQYIISLYTKEGQRVLQSHLVVK